MIDAQFVDTVADILEVTKIFGSFDSTKPDIYPRLALQIAQSGIPIAILVIRSSIIGNCTP